jgi:1-phosphatidylinositol phosphodiesterase
MKNNNWMSFLDDSITLDKLSIPGTHDSGTMGVSAVVKGFARTQNFSIFKQLEDGIRFLDIRLKNNKDSLVVVHGIVSCNLSFEDDLNDCSKFLNNNPKETIIMLVNNEGSNIENNFLKYLKMDTYEDLFCLDTTPPNLGLLRKKVVLFRRFETSESLDMGVNLSKGWDDNATFSMTTPSGIKLKIEDKYKEHNTKKKYEIVKDSITSAINNPNDGIIYITYNSISSKLIHTPYKYAWGGRGSGIDPAMNPSLSEYLSPMTGIKRFGVVMLDFYNNNKDNRAPLKTTKKVV